ncbi:hypothetical protein ACFL35_05155 [Candidatus Riflebacteria bacterium]
MKKKRKKHKIDRLPIRLFYSRRTAMHKDKKKERKKYLCRWKGGNFPVQ